MTFDLQRSRSEIVRCPSCDAELGLDRAESASGQVVCPECGVGFGIPIAEHMNRLFLDSSDTERHAPLVPREGVLFTEKAIGVATLIGGPLAGTFLMARNFRSLHNERGARLTLTIGALFSLFLFTGFAFVPETLVDKLPNGLIPFVYGLVGLLVVRSYQRKDIAAHIAAGGKKGPWFFAVGSGVVSMVVTMGYIWILALLIPGDESQPPFDGTPLIFESSGGTVYYGGPPIQESDAMILGKLLEEMRYFSKERPLPAALHLDGNAFTIELLVDEENWAHPGVHHDIEQGLRILKQLHPQRQYQFVFVMFDSAGRRKSHAFHGDS